jgi:hypothetical protein
VSDLLFLALIAAGTTPPTAVLRVQIQDSTGRAIPYAGLTITGQSSTFSANANGRIEDIRLPAGAYVLHVRAIGYRPDSSVVTLRDAESRSVDIRLARAAQRIAGLESRADPIDAFYRRVRLTGGKMVTRAAIERNGAIFTFDALQGIVGLRLQNHPMSQGGPLFDFTGCGSQSKTVGVWLNGRELGRSPFLPRDLWEGLNVTRASEIELIEVYRRYDEIPPEFRNANACAALVIWTTDVVVAGRH